jgi:hypothetical protein
MTHHDDDVLRELREALRVQPSPAFTPGVRARVADATANARRRWWALAACGATAAAAAALLMVVPRGAPQSAVTVAHGPVALASAPASASASPLASAPVPPSGLAADAPSASPASRTTPVPPAARVVVSPDEARTLDRFLVAMQSERLAVPWFGAEVDAVTGELLPPAPLELPPVSVTRVPIVRDPVRDAVQRRAQ